jgi:uncharacterized protein
MRYPLDIGVGLVAARRARRVSQRELGALIGVAQQQIARWEAAEYRSVALERVDAVARALDLRDATDYLPREPGASTAPVRDLGGIAGRVRAHSDEISARWGITRVGVFGSFASGEQTPTNSVELLVEMAGEDKGPYRDAAEYLEGVLGREVELSDPALLTPRRRSRVLSETVYVWPE